MIPEDGPGPSPEPVPELVRDCEFCGRTGRPGASFCSACGHVLGMPVTAAELRRSHRRFEADVRADLSRIWSVLLFYGLLLGTLLVMMLVPARPSSLDLAGSAAIAVIALGGALRWRSELRGGLTSAGFGWGCYGLILLGAPVTFAAGSLLAGLVRRLFNLPDASYSEIFLEDGYSWGWVVALVAVHPALFEEIAFRGVVIGRLQPVVRAGAALGVSSATFAILHLDAVMFPFLLLMGLYLGWLRQRSGSLYPGMVAHFAHNGLVILEEAVGFMPF